MTDISVNNYFQLTKPSIMILVILTGAVALIVQGDLNSDPLGFFLVLLGLYCTGGGANALNQCFEKDIDTQMKRTAKRRPLPQGKITLTAAFVFSTGISIIGVLIFYYYFNLLSALISLGTVLFYSLFYTLWLKPNTPQNIVIGGAAGAMPPIIAWAAVAGTVTLTPFIMFLIVFFWTPPHFWALALYFKEDYKEVSLPMMPIIAGDRSTLIQMMVYNVILFATTIWFAFYEPGVIYFTIAVVFGLYFSYKLIGAMKSNERSDYFGLFKVSIYHLFAVFIGMAIDSLI